MPSLDPTDLGQLRRRAFRHSAQDGLLEILAGVLFVMCGVMQEFPPLAGLVAFTPIVFGRLLTRLKERFAFQRVGYARLPRDEENPHVLPGILRFLVAVVVVFAIVLALFGDVSSGRLWLRWLPALVGTFCSGGFLYLAGQGRLWRHRVLAALSCVWGIACSLLPTGGYRGGVALWCFGLAAALLLTGTVVFVHFLRRHPAPPAEAEAGHG